MSKIKIFGMGGVDENRKKKNIIEGDKKKYMFDERFKNSNNII